jgi:hypothetical protein
VQTFLDAFTKAATKVIYFVVGFRAGYSELNPCNQSFQREPREWALRRRLTRCRG